MQKGKAKDDHWIVHSICVGNTQYHIKETYKLKEEIDNLLGFNVYNLFPDIVL